MQFSDVIGLGDTKQHLADMMQHNRLSHALLFLGKEGNGALPLAIAFSQYVVCENKPSAISDEPTNSSESHELNTYHSQPATHQLDSCGECPACIKAAQYAHPDIHYSYPVIPKKSGDKPVSTDYIKDWREFLQIYPYGNVFDWLQHIGAENKQGNITAEECSDIIRTLSLKSFESKYKILVLWMPEYLGKEGNKLLKLIEEPPANTLFILVAENEEAILPTILSRCQLVKVPAPDDASVREALHTRGNVPLAKAQQVAAIVQGNYREALQQLQHAEDDWQSFLSDWLKFIIRRMLPEQLKWLDEISKLGREKQKQFLRYFNHLIGQSIRIKVLGPDAIAMPDNERDFAQRLGKIAGVNQQHVMSEELDKAIYHIERNAHARMLFHALTIRLHHIIQDKALILTE